MGAIVRTDSEDTKTTTTGTNKGVTIDSDNITVLGNMTDGSLTTTAAKFNANQQTGSLLIGAKTTVLGGVEDTETVTQSNKTHTTRVSVDVHHAAVDTISAAEQVKEAGSALAAAKNALSDAKDRASRGELSQNAVKDYEINLAAATLNLANAQINLGSTVQGAANTAGTLGFSATANAENTQTTSTGTQTQGQWQGTELNGANATFVGDDFTGVGLKGNIRQLNIDNLSSLNLKAGTNTSNSSSNSKTNSQTGSISTTGSASLGISIQQSQSQSQENTYTNSELNVGEFNGYAGTTNLTGGRINAGGGNYATDNLTIKTVQNTASSSNSSSGSNLGINFNSGLPSGGSIGANKGSGSSQSITATEQSGIVYSGDNHSLTANNTTNIGGIIANIKTDSDGNQSNGNLNFTTGTLVTKHLVNTATQEQRNIGASLSTGKTATGVSLNNVGLQLGNTGQEFESKTLATIGQGAVVTSDASTGQDSLTGVNRDALNTETVTKDMQTGGLAVDTGIDTRVFTSAGRDEIIDEQKELAENIKETGKDIAGAAALGYEIGKDVYNAIQIAKKIEEVRDTLTLDEQVIFDNELKRLQVENSLESNIAPAIYGAEVAAAGAATAAGATCKAVNCPEALINGAGSAKRALEVARMAQLALLGSVIGIFKSEDGPKTGNDALDDVFEGSEKSDDGEYGYKYPGTQDELVEKLGEIEGAVQDIRDNGTSTTTLPDGRKISTYPARATTDKPGFSIGRPGKRKPAHKGDTQ